MREIGGIGVRVRFARCCREGRLPCSRIRQLTRARLNFRENAHSPRRCQHHFFHLRRELLQAERMPMPVSVTSTCTYSPGGITSWPRRIGNSLVTLPVRGVAATQEPSHQRHGTSFELSTIRSTELSSLSWTSLSAVSWKRLWRIARNNSLSRVNNLQVRWFVSLAGSASSRTMSGCAVSSHRLSLCHASDSKMANDGARRELSNVFENHEVARR